MPQAADQGAGWDRCSAVVAAGFVPLLQQVRKQADVDNMILTCPSTPHVWDIFLMYGTCTHIPHVWDMYVHSSCMGHVHTSHVWDTDTPLMCGTHASCVGHRHTPHVWDTPLMYGTQTHTPCVGHRHTPHVWDTDTPLMVELTCRWSHAQQVELT